jgi:hypothetical protein
VPTSQVDVLRSLADLLSERVGPILGVARVEAAAEMAAAAAAAREQAAAAASLAGQSEWQGRNEPATNGEAGPKSGAGRPVMNGGGGVKHPRDKLGVGASPTAVVP